MIMSVHRVHCTVKISAIYIERDGFIPLISMVFFRMTHSELEIES